MKLILFLISLLCFWFGASLISKATPPEFSVNWSMVCGSWIIGLMVFFILFHSRIMSIVRMVESSRGWTSSSSHSLSRKMVHPHAERVEDGVIFITGDVDKLQRGMHYQVSAGLWTKLNHGGWRFEAPLNKWQTEALVDAINTSDGI